MQSNLPNLIGIVGYAQHGKDSVGRMLADHGAVCLAFADKVRAFALAVNPLIGMDKHVTDLTFKGETPMHYGVRLSVLVAHYGWDECKKRFPDVRTLLQRIGTEGGRKVLGPKTWTAPIIREFQRNVINGIPTVITDVRFLNEGEEILERHGVIIRVTRYNDDGTMFDNGIGKDHPSERDIDKFVPDYEIRNEGSLGDLRTAVEAALGLKVGVL